VQVAVLGPVKVHTADGEVPLRAAKERSVVAALALRAGAVVGAETLIDAVWGDSPPASARKTLQTYISNIRRALGAEVVATDPNGYVLAIDRDAVDVLRFRRLVRAGESELRAGDAVRARASLSAAIALWGGEPFGGVGEHTGLAAEAARLGEEHLSAVETRVAACLDAGEDAQLVGELEAVVRSHPFRERLWGQLMVALHRSGRQADALVAYERARVVLRDELGLEPGGELRRIHREILEHPDPAAAGTGRIASARRAPLRSSTRYAVTSDGVHVAYQIVGDGPVDLVAVPGFVSHLDMWWDAPTDTLVRRLASCSRLIMFDKRGMGLSDRPARIDVDDWVEDLRAVLDAAEAPRAAVLGISAGAPTATLFAARYPERTRALMLYGGYPRMVRSDDDEFGFDQSTVDTFIDRMQAAWGTGFGLSVLAPSLKEDATAREFWARLQTTSASPGAAANFLRALAAVDVTDALARVDAPTLLLHAERDVNTPIEGARICRDLIPDARLVELDSDVHLIWLSDVIDEITDEIEAFVAETLGEVAPATVLTTIVATAPTDAIASCAHLIERHGGEVVRVSGVARFERPTQALRGALALSTGSGDHRPRGVGVGIHSGECRLVGDRVEGYAVDLAKQLAATADPGDALVSRTVRDLVAGAGPALSPHAPLTLDGTEWQVFRATDVEPAPDATGQGVASR
jgi:DNA-binding SARP family transcriptional activator/pimeloyl-ACP methyl ester carboxylesterase